jgi:hypothetical protein
MMHSIYNADRKILDATRNIQQTDEMVCNEKLIFKVDDLIESLGIVAFISFFVGGL